MFSGLGLEGLGLAVVAVAVRVDAVVLDPGAGVGGLVRLDACCEVLDGAGLLFPTGGTDTWASAVLPANAWL